MVDTQRVLVPLAPGFEEIEAVAIVDVLRRAGIEVVVAGLDARTVVGAHAIAIGTDTTLDQVELDGFDAIALPGGMPGTLNLMRDARVLDAVRSLHRRGKLTAAVCAAPMVLAEAGVLSGVEVTAYPSARDQLKDARVVATPRVVHSGNVCTSQGPGTAIEFALGLVERLLGTAQARTLRQALLVFAE